MDELAPLTTQETETPSMESTIAESWKEISKDLQEPNTTIVRDGTGKFTKQEEATDAVVKTEPVAENAEPVETLEKPEDKAIEGKKAPSSWKKEAQESFAALPAHVQDEILRREGNIHQGIEGYKAAAEVGKRFEQVAAPYMNTLKQLNITPEIAFSELLKADHTLRNGPPAVRTQALLQLAQTYGIDLGKEHDPQVAELQRKIFEMEQRQTTLTQSNEQRELDTLASEVESFSSGKEHFDAVYPEMTALLPMFRAQNPAASNQEVLQMAYDRAIYANPQTRTAILAKQQEEHRQQAQRKANEAKKAASVNVITRGVVNTAAPKLNWEEQIRADAVRLGLVN